MTKTPQHFTSRRVQGSRIRGRKWASGSLETWLKISSYRRFHWDFLWTGDSLNHQSLHTLCDFNKTKRHLQKRFLTQTYDWYSRPWSPSDMSCSLELLSLRSPLRRCGVVSFADDVSWATSGDNIIGDPSESPDPISLRGVSDWYCWIHRNLVEISPEIRNHFCRKIKKSRENYDAQWNLKNERTPCAV